MAIVLEKDQLKNHLEELVRFHRHLYYNKTQRISDQEFDSLVESLRAICPDSPVLSEVGAPVKSSWPVVKHNPRMRSLANAMTVADYKKYLFRCRVGNGKELVAEDKVDGFALRLIYSLGEFQMAVTRGDGLEGEDVSLNVKKMKFFKQTLPEPISATINCEGIMLKSDFNKLISILPKKKNGEPLYKNPRNAASGIIHRHDGMYCENISIVAYDIESSDINFGWEMEKMDYLSKTLDFVTPNYKLLTKEEVITLRQKYVDELRDKLGYVIDGLVIKLNKIHDAKYLGFHSNGDPVAHVAFKFDQKGIATKVKKLEWRPGRTGKVTPLVWFDPIMYDGTLVKKASACNIDEVNRLGMKVGDTVMIVKSGEIIPKVISVIEKSEGSVNIPVFCPSCNEKLSVVGADLFCKNDDCPARSFRKLKYFIDTLKKRNGLEEIGPSLIEKMQDANLVDDPADFFNVTVEDILNLDRIGEKRAAQIYENIQASKKMSAQTFLTSLGINSMASSTAEMVLSKFSFDEIINGKMTESELCEIEGIDTTTARSILAGIIKSQELIKRLLDVGIEIIAQEKKDVVSSLLSGKSFEISGKFNRINPSTGSRWSRDELYDLIISHGGEIKSIGKSSGPDYFINMKGFGSKTDKAQSLGVTTIGEDQFWEMIEK